MSAPLFEPDAFTIEKFCALHDISKSFFYNLQREGKAPRIMRVGSRIFISREAAAEWRAKCEATAA